MRRPHRSGLAIAPGLVLAVLTACSSSASGPTGTTSGPPPTAGANGGSSSAAPSSTGASNHGKPAAHRIDMTNVETTDASLTKANGVLTGTPFGRGTGVFQLVTPTNTTFVFTFRDGTLSGRVTGSAANSKAVLTSGTGAYASIVPTPFAITVANVSGRTVTYHFTGSITY